MKSSLGKLRRFALHKGEAKEKSDLLPSAQLDELAQAAQDMQDMRNCYDTLLSAAAAMANNAYEFSESLREIGSCLLERMALHDNEESSQILLMLGKVQFELQKLVDNYRSHILLTITNPSESLLNELRTVEDMKRQCDEKRIVYEYMVEQQKEKGRSKGGRGEIFSFQQLQAAQDEYHEEATLCVFRLKSLKQGQSRSLLTQAARHHAAQLNFFRKALKTLESVEPHVRMVTEQHHIDYHFSALEDDVEDAVDGYNPHDDGELSFDYRANEKGVDVSSAPRNSMEVDGVGISFPVATKMVTAQVQSEKSQGDLQISSKEHRTGSHSAPLFQEKKFDPAERVKQIVQSSRRKSNAYVLPTPNDSRGASKTVSSAAQVRQTEYIGQAQNIWHSSPLEQKKHDKDSTDGQLSEVATLKAQLVPRERNGGHNSTLLPLPLVEGALPQQLEILNASEAKKVKRKSVSGPLTSNTSSTKPVPSASGPVPTHELPQLAAKQNFQLPIPQPLSSPRVSPTASPPLVSSPRISELHELPRPPVSFPAKPAKSIGLVGHSAPLVLGNQEPAANHNPVISGAPSPLPTPPLTVPRSFSIPSSNQRAMALHVSGHLDSSHHDSNLGATSPPLTPISLMKMKPMPAVSEIASQSAVQIRGDS